MPREQHNFSIPRSLVLLFSTGNSRAGSKGSSELALKLLNLQLSVKYLSELPPFHFLPEITTIIQMFDYNLICKRKFAARKRDNCRFCKYRGLRQEGTASFHRGTDTLSFLLLTPDTICPFLVVYSPFIHTNTRYTLVRCIPAIHRICSKNFRSKNSFVFPS